ncbi:hypothetical protein Hanom_Chr06g00512381 [Helianthus anomalus]
MRGYYCLFISKYNNNFIFRKHHPPHSTISLSKITFISLCLSLKTCISPNHHHHTDFNYYSYQEPP